VTKVYLVSCLLNSSCKKVRTGHQLTRCGDDSRQLPAVDRLLCDVFCFFYWRCMKIWVCGRNVKYKVRINTVNNRRGLFDSVFLYRFVHLALAGERETLTQNRFPVRIIFAQNGYWGYRSNCEFFFNLMFLLLQFLRRDLCPRRNE
jgi:hypothetical protein